MDIRSQNLCIEWTDPQGITAIDFAGLSFPQPGPTVMWLNGVEAPIAGLESAGESQTVCRADAADGSVRVTWTGGDRIRMRIEASSRSGVVCEAGISFYLPSGDVHSVSALGRNWLWNDTPDGSIVSFDDPALVMWQFFVVRLDDSRWLRVGRQVHRRADFTVGHMQKLDEAWRFVWKWQPQNPYPKEFIAQDIEFEVFPSMEAALDEHRTWMESEFGLLPKENSSKVPDWFKSTRLVIQANLGETNGAVVHDYGDIANLAEDLHRLDVPEHTIIYIPDYNLASLAFKGHHGPICALWPENPMLGGKSEFVRMVKTAKRCGYHIMPHASIILLVGAVRVPFKRRGEADDTWRNPEWDEMKQWAVTNSAGEAIQWPPLEECWGNIELRMQHYPYTIRYLNQAFPEVQRFFVDGISQLISEYGLDSVYFDSLDATICRLSCWNAPYEDGRRAAGQREIISQIYGRHPDVLLAGEGCNEESADLVPLWNCREAAINALIGEYVYTFAHTGTPSPIPQRYNGVGLSAYDPKCNAAEVELTGNQPNNIPRLLVNYRDHGIDGLTRRCIEELLSAR